MQPGRKGECENQFLRDLEAEGNLALLLIHALIGQPAKEHFVGGVVGIDGYADASGNVESIAVDVDRPVHGVGYKQFLQVPGRIGKDIVSPMIRGPGVEEEDEGPDDEAGDNGDLAEALARQADLKHDGGCKIQDEEKEIGCIANGPGGGEEP